MFINSDLDSSMAAVPHPAHNMMLTKLDHLGNQRETKPSRKHLEVRTKLAHAAECAEEIKEVHGI